ncbi:MAG: hypothetical protein AB1728_08830 [Bacteroidota bacterium]
MSGSKLRTIAFCCFIGYQALYLSIGCSAATTSANRNAAPIVYNNTRIFPKSEAAVYSSLISVYQKRGYVVTLLDRDSGFLNGEYYTSSPLPNDDPQTEPISSVSPILVILSFIFIIGFVFLLFESSSSSNNNSTPANKENDDSHHHHEYATQPETTYGYKYVLSSMVRALSDSTCAVELNLTQVTYTNGSPGNSINYKHAGFTNSFFDALQNELYFTLRK